MKAPGNPPEARAEADRGRTRSTRLREQDEEECGGEGCPRHEPGHGLTDRRPRVVDERRHGDARSIGRARIEVGEEPRDDRHVQRPFERDPLRPASDRPPAVGQRDAVCARLVGRGGRRQFDLGERAASDLEGQVVAGGEPQPERGVRIAGRREDRPLTVRRRQARDARRDRRGPVPGQEQRRVPALGRWHRRHHSRWPAVRRANGVRGPDGADDGGRERDKRTSEGAPSSSSARARCADEISVRALDDRGRLDVAIGGGHSRCRTASDVRGSCPRCEASSRSCTRAIVLPDAACNDGSRGPGPAPVPALEFAAVLAGHDARTEAFVRVAAPSGELSRRRETGRRP